MLFQGDSLKHRQQKEGRLLGVAYLPLYFAHFSSVRVGKVGGKVPGISCSEMVHICKNAC